MVRTWFEVEQVVLAVVVPVVGKPIARRAMVPQHATAAKGEGERGEGSKRGQQRKTRFET